MRGSSGRPGKRDRLGAGGDDAVSEVARRVAARRRRRDFESAFGDDELADAANHFDFALLRERRRARR